MDIEDKSGVGEKIKIYREERGWSQKELADKADVSPSTISKAEGGIFTPSPDKLQRVADALGIPFSELVDLKAEIQVDTLLEILSIHLHRQEYDDASRAITELKTRSDLLSYQKNNLVIHEAELLMRTGCVSQSIGYLTDLATALDADRDTDTHLLATVYNKLGNAYYFASEMLNAHNHYSRAYQISLHFPEPDILSAQITYNLGHICLWLRRDQEAILYLETARTLYEKVSNPSKLAKALYVLGLSYYNARKLDHAEVFIKQARALYESLNVLEMSQMVKRIYAFFILGIQEPEKAIDELIDSIEHLEKSGETLSLAYTHSNIALLYMRIGDKESARHHLEVALGLISDEKMQLDPKFPYIIRAHALFQLDVKEYAKSIESAFKSSELFGKIGLEKECASSLEIAVKGYKGLGDVHAALDVSERVTKILSDAFPENPIF